MVFWGRFSRQCRDILSYYRVLAADVICFQETKLGKAELDRDLAMTDGWCALTLANPRAAEFRVLNILRYLMEGKVAHTLLHAWH